MEAKLIALDTTSVEVVWRHELLIDLWVDEKPTLAISKNYDNRGE